VRNDFRSETGSVKLCVCSAFIAASVSSVGAKVQVRMPPMDFRTEIYGRSGSHHRRYHTHCAGYCVRVSDLWCISLIPTGIPYDGAKVS
jgi:hypothetical protein